MDDRRRQQIMDEARRNIADKAEIERDLTTRLQRVELPDRLTLWRADAAERDEAVRQADRERREEEVEHVRQQTAQQEAIVRGQIEAALARYDDVIAGVISHERKTYRAKLAKLEKRLDALEARQRGVADLPSPLVRRVRITDAA
jgi:hypothetical protein